MNLFWKHVLSFYYPSLSLIQCRPALDSLSRFVETPDISQEENNLREHVEQATICRKSLWAKHVCYLGCFTTQLLQSHHLTVCRLDGSRRLRPFFVVLNVLKLRRSCSTAAAAALAHDHVWSWCHFDYVVTHCTFQPFAAFSVVRD